MTQQSMSKLSVSELVERFTLIALAQDEAIEDDRDSEYNRLYDEMELVKTELRERPGDQRPTLIPLLNHPNAQVRLKAAIATLAVARELALQCLENLSISEEYPQTADARRMIRSVAEGRYKPI